MNRQWALLGTVLFALWEAKQSMDVGDTTAQWFWVLMVVLGVGSLAASVEKKEDGDE